MSIHYPGEVSKTRGEEDRPNPAPDRGVRGVGLLHVIDDQLEEGVVGTGSVDNQTE